MPPSKPNISRVLVTGSTGNIGKHLQIELKKLDLEPIAMISSPEKSSLLQEFNGNRISSICAIYEDETALRNALSQADMLFLLIPFDEAMVSWGKRILTLAKETGITQIVKISAWQADINSDSKMAVLHGKIDQLIRDSGIPYTILSCNSFMENYTHLYGGLIRSKKFFASDEGDASMGFIAGEDIARVAANCFKHSKHLNRTYYLTGRELLTHQNVAELLSQQLGHDISYLPLTGEQMSAAYKKLGLSEWKIEVLESLSRFLVDGHAAALNETVETVTGCKPKLMQDFITEHLSHWQSE